MIVEKYFSAVTRLKDKNGSELLFISKPIRCLGVYKNQHDYCPEIEIEFYKDENFEHKIEELEDKDSYVFESMKFYDDTQDKCACEGYKMSHSETGDEVYLKVLLVDNVDKVRLILASKKDYPFATMIGNKILYSESMTFDPTECKKEEEVIGSQKKFDDLVFFGEE